LEFTLVAGSANAGAVIGNASIAPAKMAVVNFVFNFIMHLLTR
jgi:hypothetical protein